MSPSDHDLTSRAVANAPHDPDAWLVLFKRAQERMEELKSLALLPRSTRDDILQESIMQALEGYMKDSDALKPKDGSRREAFFSLLATIVNRRVIDEHRRRGREDDLKASKARSPHPTDPGPATLAEQAELIERIRQLIDDLPDIYRVVLEKRLLGMTPEEIATEEMVPSGTIRSQQSRALAMIRDRLRL
jgi:RNA polymerase sigma factor (sigma-70 family)